MERLLNPLEQIQLLLTIHTRLEEQEYVQLRYCMFDAIFSEASAEEGKVSVETQLSVIINALIA